LNQRFSGFLALLLAMTALFVIACGTGDSGGASGFRPEASTVPPTFVRIAVTPAPTETPTPTPLPTATLAPATINRDTPVFPEAFDPDFVEVRPDDEAIFAGWTDYLSNTELNHDAADGAVHFCSNGVVMSDAGLHPVIQNWKVHRSAAISSTDWGIVGIEVELMSGRFEGWVRNMLTLVRRAGRVVVTNTPWPSEAVITRSSQCLSLLD
jgi:hypothetical protein